MCGITGGRTWGIDPARAEARVREQTRALAHRGPDDEGFWSDGEAHLGHRRLSVIDLRPTGHQPMVSRDGRWVVAFNGEVYDHARLRERLPPLRGSSDTEALLETVARDGPGVLADVRGMYAVALWDGGERALHLARDPFGKKPLYYRRDPDAVWFASQPGPLARAADEVDPEAEADLLRLDCVGGARSIYRAVRKVPPGTMLTFDAWGREHATALWDPAAAARRAVADRGRHPADAAAVEAALAAAVRRRLVADVPVGCFLSAGIDSGLVTALARREGAVHSFTLGFEDHPGEAELAQRVAEHLGTEHRTFWTTPEALPAVVEDLPRVYDEPFADHSQVPMLMLSRAARPHVTVALTGDGADEVFGGYPRYPVVARRWRMVRWMPRVLRRAASGLAPEHIRDRLAAPGLGSFYEAHLAHWDHPPLAAAWHAPARQRVEATPVRHAPVLHGPPPARQRVEATPGMRLEERLMLHDTMHYLPDDILVKADRAGMSVGLEFRSPYLDRDLFDVAWRLPPGLRAGERGKDVLRHLARRHLPAAVLERAKTGFGVPLDAWLRGPLRSWADERLSGLDPRRFDVDAVRRRWASHQAGRRDAGPALWNVLMLDAWLDVWMPGAGP